MLVGAAEAVCAAVAWRGWWLARLVRGRCGADGAAGGGSSSLSDSNDTISGAGAAARFRLRD